MLRHVSRSIVVEESPFAGNRNNVFELKFHTLTWFTILFAATNSISSSATNSECTLTLIKKRNHHHLTFNFTWDIFKDKESRALISIHCFLYLYHIPNTMTHQQLRFRGINLAHLSKVSSYDRLSHEHSFDMWWEDLAQTCQPPFSFYKIYVFFLKISWNIPRIIQLYPDAFHG